MAKKKKLEAEGVSTEEKIKAAASVVFTQKGYAATRTRDIAEASGINLALLNYYFRSKEKLFDIVMQEKMSKFFGVVAGVVEDSSTSLEEKTIKIVNNYLDLLDANPDLPIFILSEIRANPARFASRFPVSRITESELMKQIKKKKPELHPVHFLMNLLGLIVFPFIMKPVLKESGIMNEKVFSSLMVIRRDLIPKWVKAFLKTA